MSDITIPPEAFTAAELAYTDALARNQDPLRAAIAVALEEAAKVADAEPTPEDSIDNYDASAAYWSGRKEAAVEIAAAIRAMIKES